MFQAPGEVTTDCRLQGRVTIDRRLQSRVTVDCRLQGRVTTAWRLQVKVTSLQAPGSPGHARLLQTAGSRSKVTTDSRTEVLSSLGSVETAGQGCYAGWRNPSQANLKDGS